jgi:hypothetical protein
LIPAFIINKIVSKILSLVLERTGEHHSRLEEKLEWVENELIELKQNIEMDSIKNTVEQQDSPKIRIDQLTIETFHIDQVNINYNDKALDKKNDVNTKLANKKTNTPIINIRKKDGNEKL